MSLADINFGIQNAATTKGAAQYVRFNQIFADGDLPNGQSIAATVGTQVVPLQMDVLSRYPDGSVKSAILTAALPPIAAGTTLQGTLSASNPAAGAAIANNAALAQGYDLTVNMNISGLGAVTIDAAQKLASALASGDFEVLRQGALATEIRFDVPVTRALRVTFDVVTHADGSVSTKVLFQNDSAMGSAGGAILFNNLSIVENGATRFSTTNLTQYQYQVWAQDVSQDSSARPTLNIRHDIDYLEQTGAIWNYDLTASVGSAPSVPSSWTNVLGVNGLYQYMPTTGARPDIGPTTEANARWLITQDASAANYALAQAQAAGSIPWHYYDTAKGHDLSVLDYPTLWIDPRGSVRPSQIAGTESGWTTDRAHSPDVSYVAWLLTGDRYHLDMMNAQASFVIAASWNDPRQNAKGIVANNTEEVRAQAWSLRTIQEAAYANPDGSYEKTYFTQIANNNWAYLKASTAKLSTSQGEVHGYFEGVYREANAIAPWQQDFFASTTALAALQGNADARAVLKWEANFLSGRFLSSDINPYNGFNYSLNVYGNDGKTLTSWAQVAAGTQAAGNSSTGPSSGYWAELAAMSNANIITVFAGGEDPTDHRVAADAMRAYGWILAAGMPDLRTDAQYRVVPRMPDGTQIGVAEMHVVAPTARNTTFAFAGDNAFIYDRGVGYNTLIGTTGADVLIDNSTGGGDRLEGRAGDDYLIGGTGTNVYLPGDGHDYALVRGGAARFEVNVTSPGRLEIEGFRPGTDVIVLIGTVSIASVLGSAKSDGFGGTLLTISPERTIRLDGLAPSTITGTMFDTSQAAPSNPVQGLLGTIGADVLVGTAGADTLTGLAGNDTYVVNHAGDVVVEKSGQGTDTVQSSVSFSLGDQYIENLTLTGTTAINGTGNSLANTLTGNAGANILDGGTNADRMVGGAGNDTYRVDNAGDVVVEKSGHGTDTVQSSVSFSLGGQYIENLTLTGTAIINGTGNSLANTLTGNAGNNILDGGTNADRMVGGAGNDTYRVDNAGDVVVEKSGQGTDTVQSSVSFSLGGQYIENLTLTGTAIINGTGNSLANTLTGNAGNNILDGGTNADRMVGGAGNDTYRVDNAGDVVVEKSGQGTDTVQSSVSFSLGGQYIENLTLTGTAIINGTGNSLANTLTGNAGNNILDGGTNADRMVGGAGNDTYRVDNAGDVVVEKSGQGTDTVQSSVSFSLGGQYIENLTLTGTTAINGTGNSLANTLTGNAGANILDGGSNSDTLTGGAGADNFVFTTTLGSSNIDTIVDFNVAEDTIRLENAIFTAIIGTGTLTAAQFVANANGTATDSSDRIIYETDTGKLFYDSNGSAAGGQMQFALLDPGLALTHTDFFII